MTKHLLAGLSALAIVALAACGGGSSSSNPIAPPTTAPVAYQAQIVFKGPLAGSQSGVSTLSGYRDVQSMNQRGILAAPGATPVPIMVLSPDGPNDEFMGGSANSSGGTAEAVVSPMPSDVPQVMFSVSGAGAVLAPTPSPAPGVTSAPGVVGATNVFGPGGSVDSQSAGTVTATIANPVAQAPVTPVYDYESVALDCGNVFAGDVPGVTWNGTAWISAASPSNADIYMTDTTTLNPGATQLPCPAPWAYGNQPILHTPYGGVAFNTDTPCAAFSASQWTNTFTEIPMATLGALMPDGSLNAVVLFKTSTGAIAKICPVATGNGQQAFYGGAIEVSGAGVDGF